MFPAELHISLTDGGAPKHRTSDLLRKAAVYSWSRETGRSRATTGEKKKKKESVVGLKRGMVPVPDASFDFHL